MRRWSEPEYEGIFRAHPPTQPHAPSQAECEQLGEDLDRSWKAIYSQWDDGRSLVLGQTTAASSGLRDYLVRRGWL
jgi:hypothetical protein